MGMSDGTIQRDIRTGRFQQGNIGGGRPKGARSKLGEQYLIDLAEVWKERGKAALIACAENEPGVFIKVVSAILPRQTEIDIDVDITQYVQTAVEAFRLLRDLPRGEM